MDSCKSYRQAERKGQVCTSFPNDNSKHIDFVLIYTEAGATSEKSCWLCPCTETKTEHDTEEIEKINARKNFFDELEDEGIEIYEMKFTNDDETTIIKLLHCPLQRLFTEADTMKLEMNLKLQDPHELGLKNMDDLFFDDILVKKFKNFRDKIFKDTKESKIAARYDDNLKFLFECDKQRDPFSSTIRYLLTEHILNNVDFHVRKKSKKEKYLNKFKRSAVSVRPDEDEEEAPNNQIGLQFMLHNDYLSDAFILHDTTKYISFGRKFGFIRALNIFEDFKEAEFFKDNMLSQTPSERDIRQELALQWASLKKILNYQPLNLIREYFGEKIGLYFAWTGTLVTTLWIPSIIGISFFFSGLSTSLSNPVYNQPNSTALDRLEKNFSKSFDNDLSVYFAVIISLWGALFIEFFKRRNSELAYEWNVSSFEKYEPDLPSYVKRVQELKEDLKDKGFFIRFIYSYEKNIKRTISFFILLLMVCLSLLLIAALILYRVYINQIAYKDSPQLALVLGSGISSVMTTVFVIILNRIYSIIAIKTTTWENHRTQSQFEDNLIVKEFAYQFINGYSALFYLAFFRLIEHPNGIWNLGPEYQDKCINDDCMSLLSFQVLLMFIIKPLPSFFLNTILPVIKILYKWIRNRNKDEYVEPVDNGVASKLSINFLGKDSPTYQAKLYEKCVKAYILTEKNKAPPDGTISGEFSGKILLYGYLVLFGSSLSIAPLMFLLINLIDIRIDAKRLIFLYRRPVGYRAQDIGAWNTICTFLTICGVITNGLILSFTSNWSDIALHDNLSERLLFFIGFEHVLFLGWYLIRFLVPDVPKKVSRKKRQEKRYVDELISQAKGQPVQCNQQKDSNTRDDDKPGRSNEPRRYSFVSESNQSETEDNPTDTESSLESKPGPLNNRKKILSNSNSLKPLELGLSDPQVNHKYRFPDIEIKNLKQSSTKYLSLYNKLYPLPDIIKTKNKNDN